MDGEKYALVVLKDAGHSVLEQEGLSIGYQIYHSKDKGVDQINFFHFCQEKVNLIKGFMY